MTFISYYPEINCLIDIFIKVLKAKLKIHATEKTAVAA